MEDRAPRKNGRSLTKRHSYIPDGLFDLDPLMNIQLPQCNSSTSNEMQIEQRRLNSVVGISGMKAERPIESHSEMTLKRKRVLVEAEAGYNATKRDDADSNDESESSDGFHITEDDYRSMLGEHLKKYRRAQFKEAIAGRFVGSSWKRNMGIVPGSLRANSKKKNPIFRFSRHNRYKVDPDESGDGTAMLLENGWHHSDGCSIPNVLDLGGGVLFGIPPLYDDLAPHLCLPGLQLMQINEKLLAGQFKPASVASMVASDPLGRLWKAQARIGGAYEKDLVSELSMHALGSELYDSGTGVKKFSLQILAPQVPENGSSDLGSSDIKHDSAFTLRKILFEDGSKRQCEVKVLERTDGYEVIERKIPRKEPVKIDFMAVAKEDSDKVAKSWSNLVRRDLLKHHKAFMLYHKKQTFDAKKFADCCQREVKARGMRSLKLLKAAPMRIRKLARDMILFWKKLDREQAELKKKEEREAAEALKREEELRESRRQQQRLNFLLTQTELYSHFMQNKLASASTPYPGVEEENIGADLSAEEIELKEEALRVAQNAAMKQKRKLDEFDNAYLQFRQTARGEEKEEETSQQEVDAAAGIDLVNPSSMPTASTVQQPSLFQGILKEYQLKGLQWLVNCYEQGLNGILADEMGLGKTIQAMAFLAHLAEEKNIWGPFLVVAPASVLNNWADEVNRFCPDLKILPYWGAQQERSILRRNLSPKHLYKRDAGFHVLITSYQLLVTDEKYLRRVKWQYMVLDEAQAIKSATSARWKTLLSFNCRNRLLLTGTPIQNNMAELWALLHFIMPTLFDSHEQFNEWFSKGIENHAEHGGTLNEHQLNRLHSILKPFMLRRVKKDVITEMTNKKEVVLQCGLSLRQQAFYQAIKNKISLSDLLDGTRGSLNDKTAMNLMNIVMQLRKVCNHPELFEGNEGRTFVHFSAIACALLPPPFGEPEVVHYAGGHNPISYKVPKLLYRDGMHCRPTQTSGSIQGFRDQWMHNMFSVFSPVNVHTSSFPETASSADLVPAHSGTFGFSRLIDMAPSEVGFVARCSIVEKLLFSFLSSSLEVSSLLEDPVVENSEDIIEESKSRVVNKLLLGPFRNGFLDLTRKLATGVELEPFEGLVVPHRERYLKNIRLLRSANCFMPAVRAPQIEVVCADRGFAYQREDELHNLRFKRLLLGHARTSECNDSAISGSCHYLIQERETRIYAQEPLLALPYRIFGSAPPWRSFDCAKMLTDSGKLQTLDALLKVLRAENHKVLLFAQMTKMLNILESYMNHRKYKYLRLDGSSSITDRRDMVNDFQSRDDIFIFLLSTRAGGLGINLTAADTVIFYESDWNPTMDLQAMDRAHRLGQTREVTVYRLICKGTVEEKIVQRAGQKSTVQQLVMTGGQSQGDIFNVEEVVSMLLDDAEIKKRMTEQTVKTGAKTGKRKRAIGGGSGAKVIRVDDEGIASFEEGTAIDNKPPPQAINSLESANKQRQGKRIKDGERNTQQRPKMTPKSTPKTNKESKAKIEAMSEMKYDVEPKHSGNPRQGPNSQKGAPETSATWRPSIKVIKINKDYEDSKFDTTTMPLETMHGSG